MFSKRSNEKEFLDDFSCEGKDLEQNLRELKFINKWLGGNNVTFSGLSKALKKANNQEHIRIADLGCGGGDMLMLLATYGRKKKRNFKLTGVDANTSIIEYAKENTKAFDEIDYKIANVFSEDFSKLKFDIVNCTLFCHHIEDKELIILFSTLKNQTRLAIVINDLHRHPIAFYSIKWLTYFFSKSFMVKNDAKLSVLRGFKKKELETIIRASGYINYSIKWKWAFRWEVLLWA